METTGFEPRMPLPHTWPGHVAQGLMGLLLLPGTFFVIFLDSPDWQVHADVLWWSVVAFGATFFLSMLDTQLALLTSVVQVTLLGTFFGLNDHFFSLVGLLLVGPCAAIAICLALAAWVERRQPTGALQPVPFTLVRVLGLSGLWLGWPLGFGVLAAGALARFWPWMTQWLVVGLVAFATIDGGRKAIGDDAGHAGWNLVAIVVLVMMFGLISTGKDARDRRFLPDFDV